MTTATTSVENKATTATPLATRLMGGALGGLAGGLAFGAMMQLMGLMEMVAMLTGSESVTVGWVTHLAISAALGAGFGLVTVRGLDSWGSGIPLGMAYGVVWWVLGALLLMPARMGMPVLVINTVAWQSLLGHLVFGLVLGVVAVALTRAGRRG